MQSFLHNHPELADLSADALSSLRVLTGLKPNGQVEVIAATLKMPFRTQQIHSTISLNSAVDLESGMLGRGFRYRAYCRGYDRHPLSDAQLSGRILPDWKQALALAILCGT